MTLKQGDIIDLYGQARKVMKSFSKTMKQNLIKEIRKHKEADQIKAGTYGEDENGKWRGYLVRCLH